jgi:hypothetical protein
MTRAFQIQVCIAMFAFAAASSLSLSHQTADGPTTSLAVVTFTFDFPQSNPEHYSISVDATGHSRYECTEKITEDSEEQVYKFEFEISPANRKRIFEWAKQAQYFGGKLDSGNRKVAFAGRKILSYQDSQRSFTARYNYSNVAAVQQLTALFQNMASTLEYGSRLSYYHRYQKLALDDELKHMEAQAKSSEISELQAVSPALQEIVEDTSVLNGVRARAKQLIEMGNNASK